MIEVKDLVKRYGSFVAVDGINFNVKRGEIFGFLGVNGAGKTTTLRMLTGVLRPTSGSISIGGYSLANEPEAAKQIIGYIPDRPYLYPRLTAHEYLLFVADLHDVGRKEALERIPELLQQYALRNWENDLIDGFSHGMKQRLAMCAALVHAPRVLVVDEPMVGLDPHGAKLLKRTFKAYAEAGMSILLSTHSLNVAEELADRLAIIHHGKLIVTGNMSEVRSAVGSEQEGLEEIFLEITHASLDEYSGEETIAEERA